LTGGLHAKGFGGIRIDRNEGQLALDEAGVMQHPPMATWTPTLFQTSIGKAATQQQLAGMKALTLDPRDTTTPEQMLMLLERLQRGELLSPKSTQLALAWMAACLPRPKRIKGMLPQGTLVAHRPGTAGDEHYGAATNDVGIITLPRGRGFLALAVYLKASAALEPERDQVIAKVAKAAWDAFAP
jgi:beta-lactamase class A